MIAPIEQVVSRLGKLVAAGTPVMEWDSQRLFHGRGCCFPGFEQVTVDLFAPVLRLTLYKPLEEILETALIQGLTDIAETHELKVLQVQRRFLEGAPAETVWGELPAGLSARRGALRFPIALDGRQNVGFFLDMEPGRQWLEERVEGKRVLNLFAYTCAFSVVAHAAGADSIVNVDMSSSSLSQGREAHRLNNQSTDNVRFLSENILKSWGRIRRAGTYDLVIMDPPSYQPGSFIAQKDYAKLLRRIPELMPDGGDILVCLNSPELDEAFITELMARECVGCKLEQRLPGHPDFPDIDAGKQLKLLHFNYLPS